MGGYYLYWIIRYFSLFYPIQTIPIVVAHKQVWLFVVR